MDRFVKHIPESIAVTCILLGTGLFQVVLIAIILSNNWNPDGSTLKTILLGLLGVVGLVSGLGLWKRFDWAYHVAAFYFIVQFVELRTTNFHYEFHSAVRLFFIFEVGSVYFAFNYLAVALGILTFWAWKKTVPEQRIKGPSEVVKENRVG